MRLVRILGGWVLVALAAIGLHYVGLLVGLLAWVLLCAAILFAFLAMFGWFSATETAEREVETREWVQSMRGKEDPSPSLSTRSSLLVQRVLANRRHVRAIGCWAVGFWGLAWGVALIAGGHLLAEFESFNVAILQAVAAILLVGTAVKALEAMAMSSSAAEEVEREERREWVRRMRGKKDPEFLPSAHRALLTQPSLAMGRQAAYLGCWAVGFWGLGWGIALIAGESTAGREIDLGDPISGVAILVTVLFSVWSSRWVWVLLRARFGAAEAKYRLGRRYDHGSGVRQNFSKAARWYGEAAQLGHANAQERLSIMHSLGLGVREDPAEADYWLCTMAEQYEKEAEQYDPDAQCRLAKMYESGKGLPKDKGEATRWFLKAAEEGHAEAQYSLASIFRSGNGVPEDQFEAAKWFLEAAESGDPFVDQPARDCLDDLYFGHSHRGGDAEGADAVRRHHNAAEEGSEDVQYGLGIRYCLGDGVSTDYAQAARWFERAAEQGHADSQYRLGVMYADGQGVPEDESLAYAWLDIASEQGHESARQAKERLASGMTPERLEEIDPSIQYQFGVIYNEDMVLPTNAAQWYRRAARQGHADAAYKLGEMYIDGSFASDDGAEAVRWFRRAAELGHSEARAWLQFTQ